LSNPRWVKTNSLSKRPLKSLLVVVVVDDDVVIVLGVGGVALRL